MSEFARNAEAYYEAKAFIELEAPMKKLLLASLGLVLLPTVARADLEQQVGTARLNWSQGQITVTGTGANKRGIVWVRIKIVPPNKTKLLKRAPKSENRRYPKV